MKPKSTPDPATLRERALGYLARREHSRFELTRKLEAAGFAIEDIRPVLDEFEAKGWLSDRRFAESWIADHCAGTGSVKLTYDLRRRGVHETIIENALSKLRNSELERAQEVLRRRFGSAPINVKERNRQMRFLQGRGFASIIVHQLLTRTD